MTEDHGEEIVGILEAQMVLGLSDSMVRRLIGDGRLPAEKEGGRWRIRKWDLYRPEVMDRSTGYPSGRPRGEKVERPGRQWTPDEMRELYRQFTLVPWSRATYRILAPFMTWPAGARVEAIWRWFEDRGGIPVRDAG